MVATKVLVNSTKIDDLESVLTIVLNQHIIQINKTLSH